MRTGERTNGTAVLASPSEQAGEERVSIVTGDRFCTRCGYNLVGQSVLREPHYGMIIVRCPECATVAALQEYPLLGRWAGRWAVLLAVLFLITLMGAWVGSSATLFGLAMVTAEESSADYADTIQSAYDEATAASAPPPVVGTAPPGAGTLPPRIITQISNQRGFSTWWEQQGPAAFLARHGGWRGVVDPSALWFWLPGGFAAFAIGVFWSVALLTVRRRYLPLWALALLVIAAAFAAVEIGDWMSGDAARAWRAARRQVGPAMACLTLAYLVIPVIAGLVAGRSVTRFLVRALLPPRLRYALALLWSTDGLRVPGAPAPSGRSGPA